MNKISSTYPYGLKTVLKAAPVFVTYFIFSTLFCTAVYDVVYHPKDRIER